MRTSISYLSTKYHLIVYLHPTLDRPGTTGVGVQDLLPTDSRPTTTTGPVHRKEESPDPMDRRHVRASSVPGLKESSRSG